MKKLTHAKYGLMLVLLLVLGGFFAVWWLPRSNTSAGNIRNVLLISIDTCRADYLSCYGYQSKTTPNIDALAAEGILFENVIAPVPQTLPSHCTMLTGTIPPYHGVHDNIGGYLSDESNLTLAEILRDSGFATGAAISALPLDSQCGIDQGFDYYGDQFKGAGAVEVDPQRQAGETTGEALEWLEKNKDQRFFFFLHYYDPHSKYNPPEPFDSQFAASPYAGEIAYVDHCIGQVLDKLKTLDLYDSSLIIITADHGEMLGEHGELTHMYFIYQGAIKVPLIFKLAGESKAARIKSIAGLVDIVPTVCSLLGVDTPSHVQGRNLFSNSHGKVLSVPDRHLFCESLMATTYRGNSLLGIVSDRFKYIQTTRPELYDLTEDAAESNNLVGKESSLAKEMQDRLAEMLEESVRKDPLDSEVNMDVETISRLRSLGYVGGPVTEDFSFDQEKTDPKDLLKVHSLAEELVHSLESQEYEKMERYAKEMIRQRPDLPLPYEKLGLVALRRKEYSKAIAYFEKVLDIVPDHAWAEQKRGDGYLKNGDFDRAIEIFDKIIDDLGEDVEQNPRVAIDVYSSRGQAHLDKDDGDRAIADFDKVITLDPKRAAAYDNRGAAYVSKGEYGRSIRDFNKAIELDSSYSTAYIYRGIANSSQGNHEQAILDFNKALELNPDDSTVYYNRGVTYEAMGEDDQAIRDYSHAIQLNPDHTEAHQNKISVLVRHGRVQEAVTHYRQAVRLLENVLSVLNNLAWVLATHEEDQMRDEAEAVRLAERARQLVDDHDPAVMDTLAAAYANAGKFDQAVKTAEKAVELAKAAGNQNLADVIQSRLDLYQAKRPYRESVGPGPLESTNGSR